MKSPMKFYLLSFLALATACGDPKQQSEVEGEISGRAVRLPNGLGQGFESDTQTLKANCIKGKLIYVGGPQAHVTYQHDISFEEILNTISGGLSIGAKVNIFDIKGAADFASKQAADDYSSTLSLISEASVKSAVMQDIQLTDLGKAVIDANGKVNEKVRSMCGDEFVSQINYSAKVFVNAKFKFQNSQDNKEFKGNASTSLLSIGELGGQISHLSDNLKKNSTVSITATQIGGKPEELSNILSTNIITCSLADFNTTCLPALEAIVKYAKEDFPKSLANDPVPTSAKGWAEVLYKTDKYSDMPLLNNGKIVSLAESKNTSILTAAIEKAREDVFDEYKRQSVAYERASDMLRDFRSTDAQKGKLQAVQSATADNKGRLATIGLNCLKNPSSCVAQRDAYNKSKKPYNVVALDLAKCLQTSDLVDTRWIFKRTDGVENARITLLPNGTFGIQSGSILETHWKIDTCRLLFMKDTFITTIFNKVDFPKRLEGDSTADVKFHNVLERLP